MESTIPVPPPLSPTPPAAPRRPGILLLLGTTIAALANMYVAFANESLRSGGIPEALANATIHFTLAGCAALLVSAIWSRLKNPRNRTQIVLLASVALTLHGIVSLSSNLERARDQSVRELNARLPTMVDQFTRIDHAEVGPGPTLVFRMTALNVDGHEVTPARWQSTLAPKIKAANIQNPYIAQALGRPYVAVVYRYTGRDGAPIGEVRFTSRDFASH